jgi:hypothetical protein
MSDVALGNKQSKSDVFGRNEGAVVNHGSEQQSAVLTGGGSARCLLGNEV